MEPETLFFAGSAHPALGRAVATALGMPLAACRIERFPDGEVSVRIERAVHGHEVVFLQSLAPPADPNLMELLVFADAARRAGAASITAVVPYFAYARQDSRHGRREPVSARLAADLIRTAGVDRIILVDPHSPQLEGFFRIPVQVLTGLPALCADLRGRLPPDTTVVSPDSGRVALAALYARCLDAPLSILHKHRESGSETHVTHLVGEVAGRTCLIIDDMVSTGGTLRDGAARLLAAGARECRAAVTHGLFIGDALDRLHAAGIHDIVVSDSVPPPAPPPPGLRVVSLAPTLAAAIRAPGR